MRSLLVVSGTSSTTRAKKFWMRFSLLSSKSERHKNGISVIRARGDKGTGYGLQHILSQSRHDVTYCSGLIETRFCILYRIVLYLAIYKAPLSGRAFQK